MAGNLIHGGTLLALTSLPIIIASVEETISQMRSHAAVLHRLGGLVNPPVHIVESHCSGLYHLQTCQTGRPVDKFVVQYGLGLPYRVKPS